MTFCRISMILVCALLAGPTVALGETTRCNRTQLIEGFWNGRKEAKSVFNSLDTLNRAKGVDPNYSSSKLGGDANKKDFDKFVDDENKRYARMITRLALSAKPPCYVCLLKTSYDFASKAASACTILISTSTSKFSDDNKFYCDILVPANISQDNLENPIFDEVYWKKVLSRQDDFSVALEGNDFQEMAVTRRKLSEELKKFSDGKKIPGTGDAEKLADDMKKDTQCNMN